MTILEIAAIYTKLVQIDDSIPSSEVHAKEEISELRSEYHQKLMDKMTEDGIEYVDRYDAMRKAFEMVDEKVKVV